MDAEVVAARYDFAPLSRSDLPVVERWLHRPHVARWYDEPPAEVVRNIAHHIDTATVACFLVHLNGRPMGYIQCYEPTAFPNHPFSDQPAGTHGIDQFIGDPDLIGLGHGPRFIRAFVAGLYGRGAQRVVTDPAPTNAMAIRAYEKAGFRPLGPRATLWGPVLLMACDR